jgi:hypothetical protein
VRPADWAALALIFGSDPGESEIVPVLSPGEIVARPLSASQESASTEGASCAVASSGRRAARPARRAIGAHASSQWRRRGSNPQPPPCKGGALPIELRPRRIVTDNRRWVCLTRESPVTGLSRRTGEQENAGGCTASPAACGGSLFFSCSPVPPVPCSIFFAGGGKMGARRFELRTSSLSGTRSKPTELCARGKGLLPLEE